MCPVFDSCNFSYLWACWALSSAEAPAGYPYKNSNNRKNRKRAGNDGKKEKAAASLLSFPFPSFPARSLFLSPQPSHNTKRPLWKREGLADFHFYISWKFARVTSMPWPHQHFELLAFRHTPTVHNLLQTVEWSNQKFVGRFELSFEQPSFFSHQLSALYFSVTKLSIVGSILVIKWYVNACWISLHLKFFSLLLVLVQFFKSSCSWATQAIPSHIWKKLLLLSSFANQLKRLTHRTARRKRNRPQLFICNCCKVNVSLWDYGVLGLAGVGRGLGSIPPVLIREYSG